MKNYETCDYQALNDRRELFNFLGWTAAYVLAAIGFTFPLWAALLNLY